ncbi:MFS transporter [Natrialba asiatica]|uniref:Major facilitator superfamily protein n=1 Tax=Natrialba asiatica (strain ATCC 700177 / DSM 12278 / JCM 9576 / FERM P-10747 / NBRC 102637 / 172P1) TaxID=29540 RepID=M0B5W6_NATA1|nr:MFS transporter [Natrialba asiatica]ELZ05917.1 major facilitator superfamily protein [Natrialba asiatica DSM 12278]
MNENDRSITGFTMLAHGIFHTYELSIPIFIVVWLDAFDVSAFVLGIVVSIGYGLIGVGAIPSGVLSDAYGSRRLIVASVIGMAGGFFLLALAPNVVVLAAAVIVWGAAASVYHPAGLSLISRGANQRGTVFAYHGVGGNVGTAFGPLLTALLLLVLDWRAVVALLTVPAIGVVALGSLIEFDEDAAVSTTDGGTAPTTLESVVSDSKLLFSTGFLLTFLTIMIYGIYYRGLLTFLPDMIGDLPQFGAYAALGQAVEPAQYIYTGILTIGIVGQYAGGRVTDHVRTEYAFFGTLLALGILAFVFIPSSGWGLAPFLLVCVGLGFFLYATAPIYQVAIAEYAAADVHGLSYGYAYLGMFGFGAGGAALAGSLLTYASETALLATLGVLAFVGAGIVLSLLTVVSDSG